MVEERFIEYLEQSKILKTLNKDLSDAMKTHELNEKIDKVKKELKRLQDQLKSVTEIALLREKRDAAKDKRDLYKEILLAEMSEEGKNEVTAEGQRAKIVSNVKFEKATS